MAASTPEIANAAMITVFARTPSRRAVLKLSAAARIWIPIEVRERKRASEASRTAAATTLTMLSTGIRSEATVMLSLSHSGSATPFARPPKITRARFSIRKRDRERAHQQHRGIGAPQRPEGDQLEQQGGSDHDQDRAQELQRRRRPVERPERVAADHDQLPVGEVEQPHDPEDQRHAEGEQRVEAAEAERVDRVLDELGHRYSGPPPR